MQKDCEKWEEVGEEELEDFCQNVIAVCSSKGEEIECPEIPCCEFVSLFIL